MTIKLTITANGFNGNTVLVDSALTPRQVLQDEEIDGIDRGQWNLNGSTLDQEDMDVSLDDLGAPERSFLSRVSKTVNA